jgi:hypothetical protein
VVVAAGGRVPCLVSGRQACADGPSCGLNPAGKLHFVKFETSRVEDAIDFIEAKGLHRYCGRNGTKEMRVKATGARPRWARGLPRPGREAGCGSGRAQWTGALSA